MDSFSVDGLSKSGLWLEAALGAIQCLNPCRILLSKLVPTWIRCPCYDSLVLRRGYSILKLLPRSVRAETETASSLNTARFETSGAPGHAQWLLWLGLVLRGAHHPVLILLFLLCEDLSVPR